jgi:pimeloyl-ACP methyl ester carboxylesterase
MATSRSNAIRHSPASQPAQDTLRKAGHAAIRGHQLYWELHGPAQGPVLVLLHHGLGSSRSWRKQLPSFAAQGYQALAFDRWGYGRSDERNTFETQFMQHDAEDMLELLQLLGVEHASFIGHSDGGTISLLLAADHPQLVERMVLIAAHIYWESKTVDSIREIAAAANDPVAKRAWEREHGKKGPALVKAWAAGWLQEDMSALDLAPQLPRIACPTLVIQGEEDEYATAAQAQDLASGIPSAELWMIPGVGHMPPQEIPEAFNDRVLSFLKRAG